MKKTLENYFIRMKKRPNLYAGQNFNDVDETLMSNINRRIYLIKRQERTDVSEIENMLGYKLPKEIDDYINIYWHPYIMGFCGTYECIVLISILKHKGDTVNDVIHYKCNFIDEIKCWQEGGGNKKFIPIGWLDYSGAYVLYDIITGKIYLEEFDIDYTVEEKPIANSLKELIDNLSFDNDKIRKSEEDERE